MCGIAGHLGPQNSVDRVIQGLRRLEYRGYDSAGVCYKDESGKLKLIKKKGKIENLMELVKKEASVAHACIGHTRWATHGEVNDTNSHPHISETIAIVHNGIIENAFALRKKLKAEGFNFLSDTDSEVFLALLVREARLVTNFIDAIANAFKLVEGNSAFVILNEKTHGLYAVKRGAPLVCGTNTEQMEVLVSSDPYALVGIANKVYFPEDNVICELGPRNESLISCFELDGSLSKRYQSKIQDMALSYSEKGEYEHYMLKEIFEQPELIRSFAAYYFKGEGQELIKNTVKVSAPRIHICACGTAWHAGLVIKNILEASNRISCNVDLASEFRYRDPLLSKDDLGLFISQSGETADTLAAQQLCSRNNMRTVAIVNTEGSTLFRDVDESILIRAGQEIGVASTKAFTLQVLSGLLYSNALLDNDKKDPKIAQTINLFADRVESLLQNSEKIKKISEEIYNKKGFIYTGRGIYFPIALEGALKLKEIAYVHAEGYASGELKHGPIALIDEEMVNVAITGPELFDKTVSNIQEVKARKGIIVTIGPENNSELEDLSDYYFGLNYEGLGQLAPLYANVVTQLLSYYLALFKGTDIDKPRNLAKSVTVE